MRHFRPFFERRNFRPEAHSDVIYGAVVEPMGVKVHAKFDDSMSNCSRDIRLSHFVLTTTTTTMTTTPAYAGHHIRAKRRKAFCLTKTVRPFTSTLS